MLRYWNMLSTRTYHVCKHVNSLFFSGYNVYNQSSGYSCYSNSDCQYSGCCFLATDYDCAQISTGFGYCSSTRNLCCHNFGNGCASGMCPAPGLSNALYVKFSVTVRMTGLDHFENCYWCNRPYPSWYLFMHIMSSRIVLVLLR